MVFKVRVVQDKLLHKFGFDAVEGAKHETYTLMVDGKKAVVTRFSRSHDDLSEGSQGMLAQQLFVRQGFLKQMFECTKSREDYLQNLRDQGKIT